MEIVTEKEIIETLRQLKENEDFIKFQSRIIKTNLIIIGVKTPNLRNLAKEYFRSGKTLCFAEETDKYYEAVLLEGFIISFEKNKEVLKEKLNAFIKKIDNWGVVDQVCSSLNAYKKEVNEEDFNYFESLLNSEKPFTIRFGVVGLMKFFINDLYLDRVLNAVNCIKCADYYVEMGIAWLISEILIRNPQKAKINMQKIFKINHFNKFIINKSIQKACESYRVDDDTKQILKEMKIK